VKSVLTIDPGLHTGLAIHNQAGIVTTVFSVAKTAKTPEDKISHLVGEMKRHIVIGVLEFLPSLVIIEGVQVWQSAGSLASAARGNLFLLAYIVGAYYSLLSCELGIRTIIIEPTKWKGQLTEDALREWVFRATGTKYDNPHILSAVGLGVLTKGKLW
jgi:hypothetical protein